MSQEMKYTDEKIAVLTFVFKLYWNTLSLVGLSTVIMGGRLVQHYNMGLYTCILVGPIQDKFES